MSLAYTGPFTRYSTFNPAAQTHRINHATAWFRESQKAGTPSGYRSDWADDVIAACTRWNTDHEMPPWLLKVLATVQNALLQLPAPDHRWAVKCRGKLLPLFDYRMAGWTDAHEIMTHNHLLGMGLSAMSAKTRMQHEKQIIEAHGLVRTVKVGRRNALQDYTYYTKNGAAATCANNFQEQVRKRLARLCDAIKAKQPDVAELLKKSFHCKRSQWSFHDPDGQRWMTDVSSVPYDSHMVLKQGHWEIFLPTGDEPVKVPDSAGMRYKARILSCGNIPVPCALIPDSPFFQELLQRPPYHKLFTKTYRRDKIICGSIGAGEIGSAICEVMELDRGQYYIADHRISLDSPLVTICDLPAGAVNLGPAGLEGVLRVMARRHFNLIADGKTTETFVNLKSEIERGLRFARQYPKLAAEIESLSVASRSKVKHAITHDNNAIETMGDWTTGHDAVAKYFEKHIKTGKVCQHTGPYLWNVQGLSAVPDIVELAQDHIDLKLRRIAEREVRMFQNYQN